MSTDPLRLTPPARHTPPPDREPETVRVLAVGGDDLLLELVANGVEIADYARDAASAARLASWLRPDLVLLDADDCEEPLALASRLRASAPACKIVVLADSARPTDVEEALIAGADGYLGKHGAALALLAPLLAATKAAHLRSA